MNMKAKNQYLHTLITHMGGYHLAGRKEKTRILDEYCRVTGQNRKHTIRKIKSGSYIFAMRKERGEEKRTRKSFYDGDVAKQLITLWGIFDRPCGQRMKEQIAQELDRLCRFGEILISFEMVMKLKKISAREIDNTLSAHKEKEHLKQRYGKKIHPLLYRKNRVRKNGVSHHFQFRHKIFLLTPSLTHRLVYPLLLTSCSFDKPSFQQTIKATYKTHRKGEFYILPLLDKIRTFFKENSDADF